MAVREVFEKRAREGLRLWEVILPVPFWEGDDKKKRHINEEICRVRGFVSMSLLC